MALLVHTNGDPRALLRDARGAAARALSIDPASGLRWE
jgi:hypothetical protein